MKVTGAVWSFCDINTVYVCLKIQRPILLVGHTCQNQKDGRHKALVAEARLRARATQNDATGTLLQKSKQRMLE